MHSWVDKNKASEITGLSNSTFKRLRTSGKWRKGIHWTQLSTRTIRYNRELIQDWMNNDQIAHERAIANFLESLPSNQPMKRGQKAKAKETYDFKKQ
jgi:hypothetical protein